MRHYETSSSLATKKLAGKFAETLLRLPRGKCAKIVALSGELGSGKTTFIQGMLRKLGVRGRVASPTFVLMKKYIVRPTARNPYRAIYHLDAYRLERDASLAPLGFEDVISNPSALLLVEWPERLPKKALGEGTIKTSFHHGSRHSERRISLPDIAPPGRKRGVS